MGTIFVPYRMNYLGTISHYTEKIFLSFLSGAARKPSINITLPINQEPETADEYLAGKHGLMRSVNPSLALKDRGEIMKKVE